MPKRYRGGGAANPSRKRARSAPKALARRRIRRRRAYIRRGRYKRSSQLGRLRRAVPGISLFPKSKLVKLRFTFNRTIKAGTTTATPHVYHWCANSIVACDFSSGSGLGDANGYIDLLSNYNAYNVIASDFHVRVSATAPVTVPKLGVAIQLSDVINLYTGTGINLDLRMRQPGIHEAEKHSVYYALPTSIADTGAGTDTWQFNTKALKCKYSTNMYRQHHDEIQSGSGWTEMAQRPQKLIYFAVYAWDAAAESATPTNNLAAADTRLQGYIDYYAVVKDRVTRGVA